ncbi:MAG: extensin family protein [Pseudomonadota bacterium]
MDNSRTSGTRARGIALTIVGAFLLSACGAIPGGDGQQAKRPQASAGLGNFDPSPSARQCFSKLSKANVRFSPLPNRNFVGGCSQIDSIKLLDVGAEVTNLGPVRCELASRFAAWTEFAVKRAARKYLGSELERIETMGSYSCRNISGSRRLSQHAHANAIDVSGFVLADGRRITLINDWNSGRRERQFFEAIHQSACKRFGTVLSPDYNAAHRDHFHFDMSGNGYCR